MSAASDEYKLEITVNGKSCVFKCLDYNSHAISLSIMEGRTYSLDDLKKSSKGT
jgi:hypothetical protein